MPATCPARSSSSRLPISRDNLTSSVREKSPFTAVGLFPCSRSRERRNSHVRCGPDGHIQDSRSSSKRYEPAVT